MESLNSCKNFSSYILNLPRRQHKSIIAPAFRRKLETVRKFDPGHSFRPIVTSPEALYPIVSIGVPIPYLVPETLAMASAAFEANALISLSSFGLLPSADHGTRITSLKLWRVRYSFILPLFESKKSRTAAVSGAEKGFLPG